MPASPQPNDDAETLSITEVSRRTGLSADTLRYYEKAGLIQPVRRSRVGVRRYATADMEWLAFLMRLRDTGMSIADMKLFAELRRAGDESIAARLELLSDHRKVVDQRLRSLRSSMRALDKKIAHYRALLGEK
ncbi:MerR family transcriptional regulator [Nonomuraea turcica]|uniref:MerR family transcriptional regulator n=1 Tax=Nonomuraea sp. G32 TaxID=3067274 RepID=UPI00273CAEC2|nr:MerR family transcriptional regulator [Nonomuraea sp. G32]MDP4504196.1 MerR family transcriptional regulator [Nonomuraea sp. G32]